MNHLQISIYDILLLLTRSSELFIENFEHVITSLRGRQKLIDFV